MDGNPGSDDASIERCHICGATAGRGGTSIESTMADGTVVMRLRFSLCDACVSMPPNMPDQQRQDYLTAMLMRYLTGGEGR